MNHCAWCNAASGQLLHCAQCKRTHYCNAQCQKYHWALHKLQCRRKSDLVVNLSEINGLLSQITQLDNPLKRESVIKVLGLLEPLDYFWSRYLAVRESKVHGQGVFATRQLPAGAVLTGYPCHLLAVDREVVQICEGTVDASAQRVQHLADAYSFSMRGGLRLIGLPERCGDKRLLGHMLNDASLVNVFHGTPPDALRDPLPYGRLLKLYYKNLFAHCNCKFQQDARGLLIGIISTREIEPGEELLLNYGLTYWLDHNYGADAVQKYPFLVQNMRSLRETDEEFRTQCDESLRRDRETLMGQ